MAAQARSTLFISDLHLSPAQPRVAENFFHFLRGIADQAYAVYILGDLFDYWIGDDDLADPFNQSVATKLADLSRSGVKLFLMHGNRDFLIGPEFAHRSGCKILPDPQMIDLHGVATLLTHGDAMCTDDVEYQRFRSQVRTTQWQHAFLAKTLAERRTIALGLRAQSEQAKDAKAMNIMDVSAASVTGHFRNYRVTRMIHGHTHRPARHDLVVDGTRCERWVLSDWRGTAPYLAHDVTAGLHAMEQEY